MAKLHDDAKVLDCEQAFLASLRPPPEFSIADWADNYRQLPQCGADEAGPWRTARVPYMREPMEEASPRSHTEEIVLMKGSQISGTESLIINPTLFYIEHSPCPILIVEPTITVGKRLSTKRLQPSIDLCEPVYKKVGSPKSRAAGNSTLEKEFPGGTLTIGGANSAASLRSMPIRVLLADEIDAYPDDVDEEGDPLDLADRRTTNFSRPKKIYISTPTIALTSKINKKFQESDQRYFYVPCPFCNEKQIIKWENFIYDNRDPSTVRLRCIHCKAEIYEHHKPWMLENGEWRPLNPSSDVKGYHISAFYSPLGWYSWKKAVREYLKAVGNPHKMKVWVNTVKGEVWDEADVSIDAKEVSKRVEPYAAEVPEPVLCLVAGCDTQDNRIEASIFGIAWNDRAIEPYLIDHRVLYGDPKRQALWDEHDLFLQRQWKHESGQMMQVAATGIDAMGHNTDEVYTYCSRLAFRKVFALQGKGGAGRPLVGRAILNKKHRIFLYQVGVDQAKDTIYSKLNIKGGASGIVHFPKSLPPGDDGAARTLDESYFDQLTVEKKKVRYTTSGPRYYWECPEGKRNEALDNFVYALAALSILNPNLALLAREKKLFTSNYQRSARHGRRIISKGVS